MEWDYLNMSDQELNYGKMTTIDDNVLYENTINDNELIHVYVNAIGVRMSKFRSPCYVKGHMICMSMKNITNMEYKDEITMGYKCYIFGELKKNKFKLIVCSDVDVYWKCKITIETMRTDMTKQELINMIKYRPGAIGYESAKNEFYNNANNIIQNH